MEIGTTLRKPETWRHLLKPVERLQKTLFGCVGTYLVQKTTTYILDVSHSLVFVSPNHIRLNRALIISGDRKKPVE